MFGEPRPTVPLVQLGRYVAQTMPNRFLQFGLAWLLILVTAVAIWLAYRENTRTARALVNIEDSGGRIEQTENLNDEQSKIEQISFQGNSQTTNQDLVPIRDLRNVYRIDLDYTSIDDISPIKNQSNLRWLDLEDTNVDSEDLRNLERLKKLRILVLTGTKISNDGLEYVSDMSELVELRLNKTLVNDDCLIHFTKRRCQILKN